jgi:hypothetical protein
MSFFFLIRRDLIKQVIQYVITLLLYMIAVLMRLCSDILNNVLAIIMCIMVLRYSKVLYDSTY